MSDDLSDMPGGFTDRLGALDRVIDELHEPDVTLAEDLFSVVDLLDHSATLRRALTDPTKVESDRVGLAESLLQGKLGESALTLIREALAIRWQGSRRFVDALERQAVRADLSTAVATGRLDAVEDELFRFSRLIDANVQLGNALSDRTRSLADREGLVDGLLADKVGPVTRRLARRAVKARVRSASVTIAGYVELAAQLRQRTVATVRVAIALDADQVERLRAALHHQLGRQVSIQQVVDPEVLGGVRVEIGDEVIEGTMADRLDAAQRLFGGSAGKHFGAA